jgi:ubiquinone/menaquinone biosynthesis C-methylase UbiE
MEATQLPAWRRLLKLAHPEAIPRLGASCYAAISASGIFQRHYELVARDALAGANAARILDIGTGPGWLLDQLHTLAPSAGVIGLDLSPAMVARAHRRLAAAGLAGVVEVREGDAGALPFADGSFDLVVSTGSLHHWKRPIAALDEVRRVLTHGGRALLYDVAADTPPEVLRATRREFGHLRLTLFWLHAFEEPFYARRALEALAAASRFGRGTTSFVGVLCRLELAK